MYLSVYLYIYLSIYLSIYLYISVYLSIYLYIYLSICIYLYIYLSIYISVYLSIYLYISVYLSIYLYLSVYLCIPVCWSDCQYLYDIFIPPDPFLSNIFIPRDSKPRIFVANAYISPETGAWNKQTILDGAGGGWGGRVGLTELQGDSSPLYCLHFTPTLNA